MQFIGRYYHALEQKGRLSIPAPFRKKLGDAAILTQGLEGCLFLFPESSWEEVTKDANAVSFTKRNARDWVRFLANSAQSVEFDRLGRILIPEYLREFAHLEKNTVVVGSLNRVEIWEQGSYHQYLERLNAEAETIAEAVEIPGKVS